MHVNKLIDFSRPPGKHTPMAINNLPVETVEDTKFLGVHFTDNLT